MIVVPIQCLFPNCRKGFCHAPASQCACNVSLGTCKASESWRRGWPDQTVIITTQLSGMRTSCWLSFCSKCSSLFFTEAGPFLNTSYCSLSQITCHVLVATGFWETGRDSFSTRRLRLDTNTLSGHCTEWAV